MSAKIAAFALLGSVAITGLLFTARAKAADVPVAVEEPSAFGWYVGLFGGAKWGEGDLKEHDERDCAYQYCTLSFDDDFKGELGNGWIFGGVVGAQITENFRAELEVSHARIDTDSDLHIRAYDKEVYDWDEHHHDSDNLSETFILGNLWFDWPISTWLAPYIGGGAGVAKVNGSFGASDDEYFSLNVDADDWAFAWQLGGGLRFGVSEHFAIDAGYRFKAINNVELDAGFCGGDCNILDHDGDDDFDIHEHVVQVGVTMGF
jgi:opacity protein-like surface antigen